MILLSAAHLWAMRGDFAVARADYQRAQQMLNEFGRSVVASSTSIDAGQVEMLAGDLAEAERLLRTDYDALGAIGEQFVRSTVAVLLARALLLLDRINEAEALAREVREISADDDIDSQVAWRIVLAETAARGGDDASAMDLAGRALELSRETDSPRLQALAQLALATAHAAAGRAGARADALSAAAELYESKGDLISAGAVRSGI